MMTKNQLNKQLTLINHSLFAAKADNTLTLIYEKELKAAIKLVFQKMQEEIIANLKEHYNPDLMLKAHMDMILAPIHEYHKQYYDVIMKYKLREHKKGYVQGKRLVERAKQYAKNYSKRYVKQNGALKADTPNFHMKQIINQKDVLFGTSDYSAEKMANKTFVASQNTLNRVDNDINQIITDGYRDGHGINDVTKRINKRFGQLKDWEAQRIARTEIHGSHMQGIMKSYEEMGVEYTQWASAHDTRVRGLNPKDKADHVKMDGEIIPWNGTYSNGLKYPGDTSGRIAEWINCRCGNIPYFIPAGYAAPSGMSNFREEDLIPTLDKWQTPENLLTDQPTLIRPQTPAGEYINVDELWVVTNDDKHKGEYLIDLMDGHIIKNQKTGKFEFKGLALHDYDEEIGCGYVSHEEVLAHNAKIKQNPKKAHIPTEDLVPSSSQMHKDEYLIASEDGPIIKNPKTGKYEFYGLEVEYDPKKDLGYVSIKDVEEHNAKVLGKSTKPTSTAAATSTTSEHEPEFIKTSELLYDDYFGEYKIPKIDVKYNPNTKYYEYKGLKIEFDDYVNSNHIIYVKKADIDAHNTKFVKGPQPDPDVEITWRDINDLEIDPYGDYMIDDTHRVIFNEETGVWEYKKVPLFDYDEADHTGIIDADEMKKYMEDHNIHPPKSSEKYFNSRILTEKEIHGEKHVVDKEGRSWVIDNDRTYEHHQDKIQNAKADDGYGLYSQYEKEATAHWGRYGHQKVANLIYGDSNYSDWYKYSKIMEDELTPLLNKMKDKYISIHTLKLEDDFDPYEVTKLIDDYQKLEKKFAKAVAKIKDKEVQQILWEIKDLDSVIVKTPRLAQDTCFVRYGHFDEDMCHVGEVFDFDGFLSTSYDDVTFQPDATSHFAEKAKRWKIIVLAPEGTEGVRLNDYFHALTTEREWLLQRNQKFEVLEYGTTSDMYNPNRRTVTIRLLDPEM